ncbi:bud neck involved protein [Modicella reniformis]|uniref:Bud neck involved protein n=1 Tax=Modicella reniformis TaxID=1440133 RepID=A0A9P6IHV3_9FUNG|nr:bud neck involved protein [Modicella reniformis]
MQHQPLTTSYQHQQQFTNPSASPSHLAPQERYSPYARQYQHNLQQPISSHLYYPTSEHPASYHAPQASQQQHSQQQTVNRNMTMLNSHNNIYGSGTSTPNTLSAPPPSRPARQLHFSTKGPIVHTTWAPEQYDRTSDPNITAHRLTPAIAQQIKLELNQFKSQEMIIHQDSHVYTHFFVN